MLPEDAIESKIYKLVGLIVQKNDETDSLVSLDMRYNIKTKKYEYIFCDHKKDTVDVVKTLNKFPGADNIIESIMSQIFKDPIKSIILS